MSVLDEDIGAGLASAEGVAEAWPPPEAPPPACQSRDLRSRHERERTRAEAAEARCEELRRSELDARCRAGSLKTQLDKCRGKLKAAEAETKEVRRTAQNALALQGEVTRLEKLLSQAGVETSKRSTIMSLRMEVARLRNAAPASEAQPGAAHRRSRNPEETIASLREENARLKKDVRGAKDQESRIRFLDREIDSLRYFLRGTHTHKERIEARHRDEIDWLNKDIDWLRGALGQSADRHNGEIASLRQQLDRRRAAAARLVGTRDRTIAWLRERNGPAAGGDARGRRI